MLTREEFFRGDGASEYVPLLKDLADGVLTSDLERTLNAVFAFAVPAEEEMRILESRQMDITRVIHRRLLCLVPLLVSSLAPRKDQRLIALGEACWALYDEGRVNAFEPPTPDQEFDVGNHDRALESFRRLLLHHLTVSYVLEAPLVFRGLVICFARTLFEMRCFQAPPRFSREEAERDTRGETELWGEYLEKWGIYLSPRAISLVPLDGMQ
jgi:hypothetical protein